MLSNQFRNGRSALTDMLVALSALSALSALEVSASPTVADETSIFVAYPATGLNGYPDDINGCGVHDMPYAVKSYQWIARGQTGYMYNVKNDGGALMATLSSNEGTSSQTPVGWQSIFISC